MRASLETVLTNLAMWEEEIRAIVENNTEPAGITYTSPITTGATGGAIESAIYQKEQLAREVDAIATHARNLGWCATTTTHPALYIRARLSKARLTYPHYETMVNSLDKIHERWRDILAPTLSDHTCPMCGKTRLHYRNRMYVCPACDYTATPQQLRDAIYWRLTTTPDTWVTREQASKITGMSRATIRKRIQRGTLHVDKQGRINLQQLTHNT